MAYWGPEFQSESKSTLTTAIQVHKPNICTQIGSEPINELQMPIPFYKCK